LGSPSEEDHAITFPVTGFRIPLSLWGIFSYFPTSKPTKDDRVEPDEVYLLTLTWWNPHTDAYARSEEAIMDCDPEIDEAQFEAKDWASCEVGHLNGVEERPPNMPEPRGQGFVIRVDADHASDSVTRRSITGFLVWINSCLVYFMSKKQTSVETSSFGS
jgi:hypothetical protein